MVHFGIDDIYRPVYRSEFKENLVGIVKLSRERFSPEIMLLTSHLFGNPVEMDTARVYYRTIFEVASDLRCTYIPVHLWMYSYMNETGMQLEELVQEDVRLPSIEGHKAYAEIVSGKIRSYMKYGAGR
jgi:hypothetical protein